MSVISPKTIVITAYPGKQGSVTMQKADFSVLESGDVFDSGGPKKRRRLTHLTQDEKLLRRKLKNRVAAQTARDRKKALMTDLEEKVARLEEENKLLRQQNDVLRETSQSLVDENQNLRSKLSARTQPEVKTESEASSTCYSSAEGTSSDFVSPPGAVLHICGHPQHDNVISLFEKDSTNVISNSSTQAKTVSPSSQGPAQCSLSTARNNSSRVVGLSSAELESLNELIHIDHVYFKPKPQPSSTQCKNDKQVTLTSSGGDIVSHRVNNNDINSVVSQQQQQLQQVDNSAEQVLVPSKSCKRDSRGIFVSVKAPPSSLEDPSHYIIDPASFDMDSIPEDLMDSLTDSDEDAPLDLFQSLGFSDFLDEEDSEENLSSRHSSGLCNNEKTNISSNEILHTSEPVSVIQSHIELNTQKLFDEICDGYLSMENSPSPDSCVLSDSGFGSDEGEAFSPQSSSLLEDYQWQDSFTDLFPDLQ